MKIKTLIFIAIFVIAVGSSSLFAQDSDMLEATSSMVKVQLVSVNDANSYTVILDEQEIVVTLMGLDFSEADFYIFDKKHNEYAEWLLRGYQSIWIDYDPMRTTEKGTPLVYLYYGPREEELWEDDHANAQTNDFVPPKINYDKTSDTVDDNTTYINTSSPYISDPEYSIVDDNWYPINISNGGRKIFIDENGDKWYLTELNSLMLLSGYAIVSDVEFDRKPEYRRLTNIAKWCRRGMWSLLLPPNPEGEEACGVKSKS